MRLIFTSGILCAGLFTVSCWKREKPKNDVPARDANSGGIPVIQVNANAFNAFNLWREGLGTEILDYPQGYDVETGTTAPDGVFYVEPTAYWKEKFTGVPTEGAKVVNDVLEYPVQNGKQLKLKFAESSDKMRHSEAVEYCKKQNLRLPTAREIFDFCAAGTTESNYGPNFVAEYPESRIKRTP